MKTVLKIRPAVIGGRVATASGSFRLKRINIHSHKMPQAGSWDRDYVDREGLLAGLLTVSRNLGLITGASVMSALFSLCVATQSIRKAKPEELYLVVTITFGMGII